MNKLSQFLLINLLLLLNSLSTMAQEQIIIGQKASIDSAIMNDTREFWVSLPKDYDPNRSYPVCYFFDGESNFESVVAQTRRLSNGLYANLPQMILVGIIPKDRTNELTPSNDQSIVHYNTSGGYDKFLDFIQNELKPYINQKYSTDEFEILIGHFFGGLAAMHTWTHSPEAFDVYLVIDPSMWWDNEKLLREIESKKDFNTQKSKILFIAKANDAGSTKEHHSAIRKTDTILKQIYQDNSDRYRFNFYQHEDHGSVFVPSQYDGLRYIYDGFQLPVKQILKDPNLLMEHYENFSKKIGYQIRPTPAALDKFIEVSQARGLDSHQEFIKIKQSLEN